MGRFKLYEEFASIEDVLSQAKQDILSYGFTIEDDDQDDHVMFSNSEISNQIWAYNRNLAHPEKQWKLFTPNRRYSLYVSPENLRSMLSKIKRLQSTLIGVREFFTAIEKGATKQIEYLVLSNENSKDLKMTLEFTEKAGFLQECAMSTQNTTEISLSGISSKPRYHSSGYELQKFKVKTGVRTGAFFLRLMEISGISDKIATEIAEKHKNEPMIECAKKLKDHFRGRSATRNFGI